LIVVANRIKVAKGYEETFEARFKEREYTVSRLPGFIRNEVLRPVRGDVYIVKTYWESMDDFERWTKSEEFRTAHANPPPKEAFAGPNQLEIHEVFSLHESPKKERAQAEGAKETRGRKGADEAVETILKAVATLRKEIERSRKEGEDLKETVKSIDARLTRQERRGGRR
jgi:heme-degrading monooxygenase HmoA